MDGHPVRARSIHSFSMLAEHVHDMIGVGPLTKNYGSDTPYFTGSIWIMSQLYIYVDLAVPGQVMAKWTLKLQLMSLFSTYIQNLDMQTSVFNFKQPTFPFAIAFVILIWGIVLQSCSSCSWVISGVLQSAIKLHFLYSIHMQAYIYIWKHMVWALFLFSDFLSCSMVHDLSCSALL